MLPHIVRRRDRRLPARAGFTLVELLVVMAILTVLAASLVVVIPKLRTGAMVKRAGSDIHLISSALTMYHRDTGYYPAAPFKTTDLNYEPEPADAVLYKALVDRNAGGNNRGWGGARESWEFLSTKNVESYTDKYGRSQKQIRDPWNVPYYYIPATNYLVGVTIYDPDDETAKNRTDIPNCFGTTPEPDDYRAGDNELPEQAPAPPISAFYNSTTFQIHSKGPDQLTDVDDNSPEIDACDRGTDANDINNWSGR